MNLKEEVFNDIKLLIEQNTNFVITTHTNPDGDAVGSTLAWCGILKSLQKNVTVIMPNDCPIFLKWINGYSDIVLFDSHKKFAIDTINNADVVFCLDYNNLSRVEEMGEIIVKANKPLILIDHHPYPACDTPYQIASTKACSTAELVYITIKKCNFQHLITKHVAEALYTGVITDTGGLFHKSDRPEIYYLIADLINYGVNKEFIHNHIFNVYSYDRMKLLGLILKDNFVFIPEYNAAYLYITIQNQRDFNFQIGDSEGMVNIPLAVKDIKFCGLFTEYPNNVIKVSFRSKGGFPANEFSKKFFNGGGHKNAAGGRINTSLSKALEIFNNGLKDFESELKK